nr:hypothetical protein CFP56_72710 [Quercus suber]
MPPEARHCSKIVSACLARNVWATQQGQSQEKNPHCHLVPILRRAVDRMERFPSKTEGGRDRCTVMTMGIQYIFVGPVSAFVSCDGRASSRSFAGRFSPVQSAEKIPGHESVCEVSITHAFEEHQLCLDSVWRLSRIGADMRVIRYHYLLVEIIDSPTSRNLTGLLCTRGLRRNVRRSISMYSIVKARLVCTTESTAREHNTDWPVRCCVARTRGTVGSHKVILLGHSLASDRGCQTGYADIQSTGSISVRQHRRYVFTALDICRVPREGARVRGGCVVVEMGRRRVVCLGKLVGRSAAPYAFVRIPHETGRADVLAYTLARFAMNSSFESLSYHIARRPLHSLHQHRADRPAVFTDVSQ